MMLSKKEVKEEEVCGEVRQKEELMLQNTLMMMNTMGIERI